MRPLGELSLGIRTQMMFHRCNGVILDRGDYWVVKTPSNPGYFFGNFLLFFRAPEKGSLEKWRELFLSEFRPKGGAGHFTFLWDSPREGLGDVSDFRLSGFKVERAVVLTAKAVCAPARMNGAVEIRPLRTDAEWREATENEISCKEAEHDKGAYRAFKEAQMNSYRAMAEKGMGHWFGAFLDGRIVGDLGLFCDGSVGRFQAVGTHPEFRRQGICSTLVYESARYAFQEMGVTDLVMVADDDYHAARIYQSLGFAPSSKEYSALWWQGPGT
jgi:ribosomal protein S18 acetylase RimI-like enzyme